MTSITFLKQYLVYRYVPSFTLIFTQFGKFSPLGIISQLTALLISANIGMTISLWSSNTRYKTSAQYEIHQCSTPGHDSWIQFILDLLISAEHQYDNYCHNILNATNLLNKKLASACAISPISIWYELIMCSINRSKL